MAEKEGAVIKRGPEGLKWAIALYEEFGLPTGLLPFPGVVEVGLVRSTGYMWVTLEKKIEHKFKMIGKVAVYDQEMSGYIERKRVRKLKGVKGKELFFSATIGEISIDNPPTAGTVRFKTIAGFTVGYPIEAFAPSQ